MSAPNYNELLAWLRGKVMESEGAVRARDQMESTWRGGTDKEWKAAGSKLSKAQRLKESEMQGRIAVKARRNLEMFKATLAIVEEAAQLGLTPPNSMQVAARPLDRAEDSAKDSRS